MRSAPPASHLAYPYFQGSENSLIIEVPEAREEYIYVKAVTLNGKPLHRAWIRHHEIAQGAVLRFTLDTSPERGERVSCPVTDAGN